MIFLSAGHNPKGIRPDPGAQANGYREADAAIEQRNYTALELENLSVPFITDKDTERLAEYLERIKTGAGSVVLEFHFDAFNGITSGTTCLVGNDADRLDLAFAKELVNITSSILEIPNRGVKPESWSHRGKLGLMREQGTVALLEICFIDHLADMEKWECKKTQLAKEYARILNHYEKLV